MNIESFFQNIWRGGRGLDPSFQEKREIKKKNPTMNGLKMHHLHPFFKQNKTEEDTTPAIPRSKGKKSPASRISEL